MPLRITKILLTASLAAFAFIVAYDNVVDYNASYEFVRHVLSRDTTFTTNTLRTRAITSPALWNGAYIVIITAEGLTALAFTKGTYDRFCQLSSLLGGCGVSRSSSFQDTEHAGCPAYMVKAPCRGGNVLAHAGSGTEKFRSSS